jgi:hypothetical protein
MTRISPALAVVGRANAAMAANAAKLSWEKRDVMVKSF